MLTEKRVEFSLEVQPEDMPLEGNLCAIDDEHDRAEEERVRQELRDGNVWAWCQVRVVARWGDWEGSAGLGGCSYASGEDFKAGPCYEDLKTEALEDLEREIKSNADDLFPTADELALLLRDTQADAHELAEEGDDDEVERACIDVRLQVTLGGWGLYEGDTCYDTDHNGWWGASTVGPEDDLREVAEDLIGQAKDDFYSSL
jgi:hypothetical protein